MGPTNEIYNTGLNVESETMESLQNAISASTLSKFQLPSDVLALSSLVKDVQPEMDSYIRENAISTSTLSNFYLPSDAVAVSSLVKDVQPELVSYIGEIYSGPNILNVSQAQNIPNVVSDIELEPPRLKEHIYEEIEKAAKESEKSGSQLPLIKQELKLKIQAARLAKGKQELKIDEEETPKLYPLTPEEVENREKRKENNRVSAKKCRQKKKSESQHLLDQHREQTKRNQELKKKIKNLEKLKNHYWQELVTRCPVETVKSEDLYQHLQCDWDLYTGDDAF